MLMHFPYFAGCCMLLFNFQIVSFLSSFHHWLSMPTHFISWNWVLLDLSEIAYFKLGSCVTHLMLDLSIKKCVPCDLKDLRPMTEEVANGLLRQVAGWNLVNEGGVLKLNRSMKVKSFTKGLELFQLIAGVAEAEGHHPDLHLVEWNNITIEIWTHAVDGLTENDFILATKINKLNMHHLLRRKLTD